MFTAEELSFICQLCIDEDIILVTDEIYEHILFEPHVRLQLALWMLLSLLLSASFFLIIVVLSVTLDH
eukprot:COSAG02_NODE_1222_length_13800_cov_66.755565_6_plen_68_part_00